MDAAKQSQAAVVVKTDADGVVTEVNRGFREVSGYIPSEVLGRPIGLLRHPDTPKEVFADLWGTLKAGRPWVGLLLNRHRDGSAFWTEAHLTPAYENGVFVGYLAMYRPPAASAVAEAERIYRLFREQRARGLIILRGKILQDRFLHRLNPLWNMSLKARLILLSAFAPVLAAACMAGAWFRLPWPMLGGMLAGGALLSLYSGFWLGRDVADRLSAAKQVFRGIASGHYDDVIDVTRSDEPGSVLLGLKMMQIRLGAYVEALQMRADDMERIRQGLDAAATALLLTDADLRVTYVNQALSQLFERAIADLREVWPALHSDALIGADISELRIVPGGTDAQRRLFAGLRTTQFSELKAGSRTLSVILTPVETGGGQRLGYVVELRDRTDAVEVEREINAIVNAAAEGDFSRRISLRKNGRNDFFIQLVTGFNRVLDINTRALDEVVTVIDGLAEGDLTRTIAGDYRGTLAKIQGDVNHTVRQLNEIVARIRSATERINEGAREIADLNATLTDEAGRQSEVLGSTADEIRRVTVSVKRNADNARNARQLAGTAAQVAQRGGKAVDDVVTTMTSIHQLSQKIAEITSVIDGIAFQTNILALNSAVEAARAGEHGRGFAVVASEVRSLAQRAAAAAKEIKELIRTSVDQIDRGSDLAGVAGQTMREIVGSVQQVTQLITDIAAASEEQSSGIAQVDEVVTGIEQSTHKNATMASDASTSARSLEQAAGVLAEAVAIFHTDKIVAARKKRAA
jgi:methyl-accepting chemotaxis protein